MNETVAERLTRLRKARGMTQEELAKKAGVTRHLISHIETGRVERPKDMDKIARALGVSPALVQFGEEKTALDDGVWSAAKALQTLPPDQREALIRLILAAQTKDT